MSGVRYLPKHAPTRRNSVEVAEVAPVALGVCRGGPSVLLSSFPRSKYLSLHRGRDSGDQCTRLDRYLRYPRYLGAETPGQTVLSGVALRSNRSATQALPPPREQELEMPKKQQPASKRSGDKQGAGKGGRNPSVGHSRRVKDARASGGKPGRSARGVGPPCEKCGQVHKRCSAHNNRGGPCGQQPLRFQQVCRSHGGATKLSKRAAQERMMELVWPALARLDQLVNDPDTDPAIVVKVVAQILDRAHAAGLSRHAQVGVSLEPTPFDNLTNTAFVIMRGEENVIDSPTPQENEALSSGGEGDDEALAAFLAQRDQTKAREASTKLDNRDHDIVEGRVVSPDEANIFGFERTRTERLRDSGYQTEHDPEGHRPDEDPWAAYEQRLREGLDGNPGPGGKADWAPDAHRDPRRKR